MRGRCVDRLGRQELVPLVDVSNESIEAHVDQWYEFLATYHEGVLGWVGGSARLEGTPPSEQAIEDRMQLIQAAMERVFRGRQSFQAIWTYISASRLQ